MKIAMCDTHQYDRNAFELANKDAAHQITFLEPRLTGETAALPGSHDAVCSFVNDTVDARALQILRDAGVRLLALRSTGYNHVDLVAAARLSLPVVRVPEYSPFAVAEHAVALMLALNRKIHQASARVREWNFSLEGLVGFDMHGKTVGIVGTGRIGQVAARIFHGFGCNVLAFDLLPDPLLISELGVTYVDRPRLYRDSDIITLHVPLMSVPQRTRHFASRVSHARSARQHRPDDARQHHGIRTRHTGQRGACHHRASTSRRPSVVPHATATW